MLWVWTQLSTCWSLLKVCQARNSQGRLSFKIVTLVFKVLWKETGRKKLGIVIVLNKKDYICPAVVVIASTGKKKKNWREILLPLTELDWYNEYKEWGNRTRRVYLSLLVSAASKVLTRPSSSWDYIMPGLLVSSLPNLPPPFCFLCSCQLIFLQFAHILSFLILSPSYCIFPQWLCLFS